MSKLDGLTRCERACLIALELARHEGVRTDVTKIARVIGYEQGEVELAIEVLIARGLAFRPQATATGHA